VLTMSLTLFPGWAFSTMGTATSVLKDDYVTAAKARGLPSRRILFSYVAKNSILPIYTSIPISLAFLLAGAVWIESIFELPGMGYYLSVALGVRDYPLIMGYYFVIITALILGNLFTDFTYSLVDPPSQGGVRGMDSSAISRRVRSSLNSVSSILKALRRNRIAFAGFIILLIYVGIAVVAAAHLLPKIPPPRVGYSNIYAPPSLNDFPWYLLGTDYTGRPLLLILFYGTPSILLVAFIAALITVVVGLVLGLISGYIGGNVDVLISTIIDIALTLPTYVLALILVVVLPISLTNDPLVLAGI